MDVERVVEQVHGILGIGGVPFSMSDDRSSFFVAAGSARVFIVFRRWNESVVVSVRSIVLEEVDSSGERLAKIYERLNALNEERFFGKLYFQQPGAIVLEYDVLGDELDAKELMHALATISGMADELDDALSAELGTGTKWEDMAKREQGGGDGPVVPA
jgi:Putative bacterial sensory transduction regulator